MRESTCLIILSKPTSTSTLTPCKPTSPERLAIQPGEPRLKCHWSSVIYGGGFPYGVCVTRMRADGRLGEATENKLVSLAVHEVNYERALSVLLHLGIHRPRAVGSEAGNCHASTGQNVKLLARYDSRNDVETRI